MGIYGYPASRGFRLKRISFYLEDVWTCQYHLQVKRNKLYQTLISFHPGCKKKHGSLRIYPNTIQESYMTLVQHNRILYGIMWYPKCKWPTNRIHFHPRWTPDCCKMSTFPTGKIHPLSTKPPTGSHCASRDAKSKVTSFNSTWESTR